jgi:hypothetical protein
VGFTPSPNRPRPRRRGRFVAPNMADPVRLACGDVADVIPMVRLFTRDVWCRDHGWQMMAEDAKPKPKRTEMPGQQDIPPF